MGVMSRELYEAAQVLQRRAKAPEQVCTPISGCCLHINSYIFRLAFSLALTQRPITLMTLSHYGSYNSVSVRDILFFTMS